MKLKFVFVTLMFFATMITSGVAHAHAPFAGLGNSTEPKFSAKVTSNRFNIYEGDIEEISLNPKVPVEVLIGMAGDSSGTVFVEVNLCESGKIYRLYKQKNHSKSAAGEFQEVYQTDCQVGLAYLYYDLKLEDLFQLDVTQTEKLVEFYLTASDAEGVAENVGENSAVKLGAIVPRAEISEWESYLFIDELYSYSPQSVAQVHLGSDNLYLTLVTAFSSVFNGQLVDFEYSHLKNGQIKKQNRQFVLENSAHEIDFSRSLNNLDVGDLIELKYRVAGYEKNYRFKIERNYQQQVRIKDSRVVYDLLLDNVNWYQNEDLECLSFDCDFSRGGKEIEVSHALIAPVGNYYLGNYQLHFSLDGYKHLYLNTSLVSK